MRWATKETQSRNRRAFKKCLAESVEQLSAGGKSIAIFDNAEMASLSAGVSVLEIYSSIASPLKVFNGFKWRRLSQFNRDFSHYDFSGIIFKKL